MVIDGDDGNEGKAYSRKKERLTIGDAKLMSVIYWFYKSRFFKVEIRAERADSYLRDIIFARYAEGTRPNEPFPGIYFWTRQHVKFNLCDFPKDGIICFWMDYLPISDEQDADAKERQKKAVTDF